MTDESACPGTLLRAVPALPAAESRFRALLIVLFFWAGVAVIGFAAGASAAMVPARQGMQAIAVGTLASVLILLLTILIGRLARINLADCGIIPDRASLARFGAGLLFGAAIVLVYALVLTLFGSVRWIRNPEVPFTAGAAMFAAALALAWAEELAFRGFPLRYLSRTFHFWLAQALVAAAFILYHILLGWPLFPAIVGTGTGALLFGMAAIATRGLAVPTGIHGAWNFGSWTVGARETAGFWRAAGDTQLANVIGYLLPAWLGIVFFWLWHRRNIRELRPGGAA